MSSEADYGVDIYQLNVGAGDAAIYVQYRLTGSTKSLLSAVLIDGGDAQRSVNYPSPWAQIDRTMEQVKADFGLTTPLKFDSIVATHWDADHTMGLKELIMNDLELGIAKNPAYNQVSFMKYNATTGEPETVFYWPFWYKKDSKSGLASDSRLKGAEEKYSKEFSKMKDSDNKDIDKLEFMVRLRKEITVPDPAPPAPKPPPTYKWELITVKNICLVRNTPETMLGVDFFVNGPGLGDKYKDLKTLDDLLNSEDASVDKNRPAMFCVATDRHMLGTNGAVPLVQSDKGLGSFNEAEAVASPDSDVDAEDVKAPRMTELETSPPNKVSIVTLIVWRNSKRISYYASGDLDAGMESDIVEWTKRPVPGVGYYPVRVIKASHHGAAGSFPHNMLESWEPIGIIFTCGHKYSHPAWEIVYWISVEPKMVGKPVWGTCYPTYLDLIPLEPGQVDDPDRPYVAESDKKFDKSLDDNYYLDALEVVYQRSDPVPPASFARQARLKELCADPAITNRAHWLLDLIGQKWASLSNTAVASAAFGGHHDDLGNPVRVSGMVWYLHVACLADPDKDGVVTEFRNDTKGAPTKKTMYTNLNPPPRPSKATPVVSTYSIRTRPAPHVSSGPPAKKPKSLQGDVEDPEAELSSPAAILPASETGPLAVQNADAAVENWLSRQEIEPADTGFYVYGKTIAGETAPHVVVDAVQQKMFIRHLHRQVIELVKQFSQDSVESVAFQPGDEMYTWLQTSMSATALSARGKGTEVYHFDLAASLVAGATIPLAFSTESIPLQFGITPADLTAIPISEYWGTLKKYPIMVFGLSPLASGGSNPKVTMQALFAYAGLGNPLFNVNLELIHPVSGSDNTLNRRNAIWFQPGGDYKTTLRLSFEVVEVADLNSFLQSIFGDKFELKTADVTLKRDARYKIVQQGEYTAQLESSITVVATAAVSVGTTLDFSLTMVLSDGGEFQAILDFDEGADILAVVDWLGSLVGLDTDFTNWLDADMMGSPKLSRVMLVFATVNGNSTFVNGTVTFQVDFKWGTETPEEKAVFLFTYSWPRGRLSASLWPGYQYLDPYIQIYPEYEPYQRLVPKDTGEIAGGLHLSKLIPNTVLPVPEHVVPDINAANVVLDKDQIYFDGSLVWNTEGKFGLPFLNLSEVRLAAAYNWKQKNVFLSLVVRGLLTPKSTELTPADLYGSITYFSDYGWSFEAMIYNLYLSSLYSFFDEDASDGVMDMLQTIELDLLRIKLDYDSAGKSSTFIIYGSVLLGPIKANLDYIHDLSGWTLNIGVGANSEAQASLGDIMHSLAGRNVNLPECVSSIALVKKATDTDTFTVTVRKKDDPTAGEHLVCHANFTLGGLGFTFVQLRKTGKSAPTKRVIKLAVNPLPNADVPLVGSVPQLFDEMTFMWVEDSSTTGQPGLTRQDVQIINNTIWSGSSSAQGIKFKDPQPANPKPTDIVLQKGLHFLIAVTHLGVSNVILDHRFGETRDKNNGSTLFSAAPAGSVVKAGSSGGAGEVTMAPMQKKTGPLSVSNIGLQFQDNTLYIVLDATFELGPVSMSLLGFGIGVNFSGGFNLQNLPTSLEVKLEGLGVGFEKPPISMAGQFRYSSIDNLYRGGITVAFQPYVFLAAGFYGDMKGKYKTVFVFAKLTGPLITLAFAEIAGICGGFGYNNKMTFPTVTQVPTFPFIGDNMGDQSPMDALAQLTGPGGWVQPKQDVYWLIAGMSVKAFRLLSVEAVVVVEFNPYVSLGLFALCQAGFPAKAVGGVRFLFIELGIAASVDFQAGTMKVEGQLTPNSFILAPSCHLTGGFALFYWFGDNANRGDWVFTIGGFHPSFIKPAHYPNPPRLGISWKLDSALSIVGESYFAITPKCCMAGGRLRATLSLGPLSAWFDAQTNLLINFNPFFFKGDVSVSVGVKFTLKLWIVTLRISVEIGAQLYLQGPPFAGRVHVNFWVFGFNINFGPSPVDQPPVDLEGFWEMLLQDGMVATRSAKASRRRRARALAANPAAAAAAATAAANTGDHVFAVQSGLLPTSSEDAETWDVRAGVFAFCVQSRFAIQEATCTGGAAVSDPTPIYAKPMQLTSPLSSKMNITVTKHNPTVKDEVDKWQLVKVVKAVPDALWGFYDPKQDPSSSASKGNNIKELLSGTNLTVPLTMGITVASPRPVLSEDKIPKFNFVHAMAQDVFSPGEQRPDFPEVESVGGRFLPSKPEDGPKQWTVVKEAWSTPEAATAATQVLATWRKAFKWEDKEAVRGEPPKFAIQNFEEVYMSAPLLCAATA